VNHTGEKLAAWAKENLVSDANLDGVHIWSHPYGCSQLGKDFETTRVVLTDLVHHPNAGGVLVLSLGCENNTPSGFRELVGTVDPERVRFLV
jgi:altronate hydrolase